MNVVLLTCATLVLIAVFVVTFVVFMIATALILLAWITGIKERNDQQ